MPTLVNQMQSRHRILNVDDNDGARYAKTRLLKHSGFDVIEAATGAEALSCVNEMRPDLVLLDVKLPDINGLEVCRRIKNDPATASILVLQTSAALIGREDRIRGLEGGADSYLAAPIESEELLANVNALLRLRKVQNELLQSEERFRQMAENIEDIFWILSPQTQQLLYVSSAFQSMWGQDPEQLQTDFMSWLDHVHEEEREQVRGSFQKLLQFQPYEEEFRVVRPDGQVHWVRDRGFPVRDQNGAFYRIARITSDISARKGAEERNLYLSLHDSLTGLPNRAMFGKELETSIAEAKVNRTQVEVLLIDLDHFKDINDSLGHHMGDSFLQQVAQRLRRSVRKTDLVARLGGDEFAVICKGLDRETSTEQLAEKIIQELSHPFLIDGHELIAGASIGVTVYPKDAQDPSQLLRNADMAMYRAKSRGRNNYQMYTDDLEAAMKRRKAIEKGLRAALENQELSLHYQPQYSLTTGELSGVEALLRWDQCPVSNLGSAEMITVADETGLIVAIGEWALRHACLQACTWFSAGFPHIRVAVNFSSRQLKYPTFLSMVRQVLADTGLDPRRLELEITERSLMENNQSNIDVLRALKDMGVYISVDDFGTGFSSLSYLKHFPVDALKIDRMFVNSLPGSPQDAAIASAIIGMAHSLGLDVIAEGIESEEQLAYLKSAGCDFGQGYLLSHPLSGADLTAQLPAPCLKYA